MHPRLLTIPGFDLLGKTLGPFTVHAYGVLLAIAFITGLWVAGRQAKAAGLDPSRVTDMAVYVLIAGLIGAKVLLVIVEWGYYARNPRELLSILQSGGGFYGGVLGAVPGAGGSGGVFYGGLIGAFPVAWWYARKHGLPTWRTADVLAPAVVIGQTIGRLGC